MIQYILGLFVIFILYHYLYTPNSKIHGPNHVAIIMDGNRRWGKKRKLSTKLSHYEGSKTFKKSIQWMINAGVKYYTVYAFSCENWGRSKEEIDSLMDLIKENISEIKNQQTTEICFKFIGRRDRIDNSIVQMMNDIEEQTKHNTNINVIIAIDYSGRWDITNSIKNLHNVSFEDGLSMSSYPDVDLVIRTGGDMRISNFLLWQIAFSEIHFVNDLWPNFTESKLQNVFKKYNNSERRFGK